MLDYKSFLFVLIRVLELEDNVGWVFGREMSLEEDIKFVRQFSNYKLAFQYLPNLLLIKRILNKSQFRYQYSINFRNLNISKSNPHMSTDTLTTEKIIKLTGVAALSLGVNYLVQKILAKPQEKEQQKSINPQVLIQQRNQTYRTWGHKVQEYNKKWGNLKLIDGEQTEDGLKKQLDLMTRAMCDFERVSNLVADLELTEVQTYPCPFIAHQRKKTKEQAFLQPQAIVKPGGFLIRNCVFRAGQQLQNEKKFMRAGPRNTQFFNPSQVRADIVVLGKLCPGINTVIRELVSMLKTVYKVDKVFGVKNSFEGYYQNKKNPSSIIELQPKMIETIHHHGGCYLGLKKTEFCVDKIIESLVERNVNQVYLIGATNTFKSASLIYDEIKRRKLTIGICVVLKAINKDVALFDTCFGFESAVEETQRFIQMGYVSSKSYHNTVSLIKVPGWESGFLASDAARAARNVNICLVPEFPYCFYGSGGLLKYIGDRIKYRGNCVIVYAEGSCKSAADIDVEFKTPQKFDAFFKQEIMKYLNKEGLNPNVLYTDTNNAVRSIPANSFDTKLCSQISHSSIYGLMCGYTNFVCGHFAMRNGMVPLPEMMERKNKYQLKPEDEDWQRLLATTGQPNFLNVDEDKEKEEITQKLRKHISTG